MSRIDTATLWANMAQGGRRDFLVMPEGRLSFAGLGEAVRRWLAWFDACEIAPGQRMVIRTANEIAAVTGFLAAILDGVVPVLLTADTPDARANAVIGFVAAVAVVDDAASPTGGVPGMHRLSLEPGIVPAKRSWLGKAALPDPLASLPLPTQRAPRLPSDGDGLAYILFTSGTTASPSGVQITRANLYANLATLIRVFGYDPQSRIFNDMILAHADGMIQGPVLALATGCAVIRSGGFQLPLIERWLGRVRAERATHVITVPTIWTMIDRYAGHDDYFDAPECQALVSVAAKLPDDLWRRIEARFARPVFNQYGLTETVVTALWAGPQAEMGPFGTIGRPIDCAAKIAATDTSGGAEGELLLRGVNIFPGYWRDPVRTTASFTDDGWFRTGDLVRLREDGSYEMLGRLKSVIMMGGFLIRPDEIDEAMLRHPAVRESVTIGLDDPVFGEVPVTATVLAQVCDEAALTAHARNFLESQKVPKRIIVLDAIPRGDAGKPQGAALRALCLAATAKDPPEDQAVGGDLVAQIIAVAAEVFRVKADEFDRASKAGDVAGWDSFSQLNFLLAVEQRFGVHVPAAKVAAIESIWDMVRTVRELRTVREPQK